MHTQVEIDETLLAEAMEASGLATKSETVEEALRRLVTSARRRQAIASTAGIGWEGDLEGLRRGER